MAELNLDEKRTEAVLGSLIVNYGTFEKAMEQANDEYEQNIALNKEAAAAAKSFTAKLTDAQKAWDAFILQIEDGNNVIGRFVKLVLDKLVDQFERFSFFLRDDTTGLQRLTIGINQMTRAFSFLNPWVENGTGLFEDNVIAMLENAEAREKEIRAIQKQTDEYIELYGALGPLTEERFQQDLRETFSILSGTSSQGKGGIEEVKEQIRNTIFLKAKIKELKDEKDKLTITQIERRVEIDKEIAALNREIKAIQGSTKANKERIKTLRDSIGFYNEQVRKLVELRDKQALTNDEYDDFNDRIDMLKFSISELNGEYEKWLQGLALTPAAFEDLFPDIQEDKIKFFDEDDLSLQEFEEQYEDFIERQKELDDDLLASKKAFYEELRFTAFSTLNAIFDAETRKYDDRIRASNDYFDRLLENDRLTEEQRQGIRDQQARAEADLEEQKEAIQRKAFLFRQAQALAEIVITTIQAVAKIKAEAAVLALIPFFGAALAARALATIPFVIASGALAAGAIIGTTIPQLKEGDLTGNIEGAHMINDALGANYKEVVQRKGDDLETYAARNVIVDLKKGDKVYKSGEFPPDKVLGDGVVMSDALHKQKIEDLARQKHTDNVVKDVMKGIRDGYKGLKPYKPEQFNYTKFAEEMYLQNKAHRI